MKKIFVVTLILTFFLSVDIAVGQAIFELPKNPVLNEKEDYARYEQTVVDASKWLEQTDLDKETEKRQQVNAFVLKWVSGSPTVNIDITEPLSKIYGKNFQLLPLYLAAYARNMIESKGASTKLKAIKAGLKSMINVYRKGIDIRPNKEMNNIIKMTDSELDLYITDKLMQTKAT